MSFFIDSSTLLFVVKLIAAIPLILLLYTICPTYRAHELDDRSREIARQNYNALKRPDGSIRRRDSRYRFSLGSPWEVIVDPDSDQPAPPNPAPFVIPRAWSFRYAWQHYSMFNSYAKYAEMQPELISPCSTAPGVKAYTAAGDAQDQTGAGSSRSQSEAPHIEEDNALGLTLAPVSMSYSASNN